MTTFKIEPASSGNIWVTLPYSEEGVARIKTLAPPARAGEIPGHRWNPERKQWLLPDCPETRATLAEIIALKPQAQIPMLVVAPRRTDVARKPYKRYIAGRDKPLTTNPPHPLIKQVDDELVLRGMAYGTRKSYGQHLRNYFDWLKQKRIEPQRATREDIRAYLVQMATGGRASAAYCRGARMALIYLYETILKQPKQVCDLPQIKRPFRLPVVLSREEVAKLLKATYNLKHKALLTPALACGASVTAYSAGLRVGEAVRLKVSDIDSKRWQIRVTAGKGAKDRCTLLSETALQMLREYFKKYKPRDWLFPGDDTTNHLSERAAQQVFKRARKNAGINSQRHFTPCDIRSQHICLRTAWICVTFKNYLDTEAFAQQNDILMSAGGQWDGFVAPSTPSVRLVESSRRREARKSELICSGNQRNPYAPRTRRFVD